MRGARERRRKQDVAAHALDLSDNEIRDNGVIAIGGLISHLKHGLKLLDLTACHASAKATAVLLAAMKKGGGVAAGSLRAAAIRTE